MPRDGMIRFKDSNGEPIYHFTGVSSFSEYTVVDVTQVVKLDTAVEHKKLCLLSCGVSTGTHNIFSFFFSFLFTLEK
jgi:S-(hydroxymethyl)glutathione dehydrogenase / alcohol dehydrogenase